VQSYQRQQLTLCVFHPEHEVAAATQLRYVANDKSVDRTHFASGGGSDPHLFSWTSHTFLLHPQILLYEQENCVCVTHTECVLKLLNTPASRGSRQRNTNSKLSAVLSHHFDRRTATILHVSDNKHFTIQSIGQNLENGGNCITIFTLRQV
jgi:hypothetical protein